jgi:hypothetical protein
VLTVCLDPGLVDVPEVEVTAERTAKCLIAGVVTGLIMVYICSIIVYRELYFIVLLI